MALMMFCPTRLVPAVLFSVGIVGFSGSIYWLVLSSSQKKIVGPITPIGGLFLIAGWVSLAIV